MAVRLTEAQKCELLADYAALKTYRAVARRRGVAPGTVKRIVLAARGVCAERGVDAAAAGDILEHLRTKQDKICAMIDLYLEELTSVERLERATPNQLSAALGTLIDKFTAHGGGRAERLPMDGLSKSLEEMGRELQSDDQ